MTDQGAAPTNAELQQPRLTKVARVLDSYRLVLNVGRADGVNTNHSFLVYGIGPDIIDPDSGENLGALEIVRGRGKVEHLQERFCTIRSTEIRKVPGLKKTIRRDRSNVFGSAILGSLGGNPVEEVEEGMRTIEEPFEGVEVGDFARRL